MTPTPCISPECSGLLPCPFCGGEAALSTGKYGDGSPWHYVECGTLDCGAIAEPDVWNTRASVAQSTVQLGDIVKVSERAPYFHDWRGSNLKVVSLRIDPEGKHWASVIDSNPDYPSRHRGGGFYDGETTDMDADYLCLDSSTDQREGRK